MKLTNTQLRDITKLLDAGQSIAKLAQKYCIDRGTLSSYLNKIKSRQRPQLRVSFIGTENFISNIKTYFDTQSKIGKCGTNKIQSILDVGGNKKAKDIYNFMYKNATIFLTRKQEVFNSNLCL